MHGGGEAEKWPTRLVTTSSRPADDCDVIGNNAAGYVVGPQGKKIRSSSIICYCIL
jgi:hypothetical protein